MVSIILLWLTTKITIGTTIIITVTAAVAPALEIPPAAIWESAVTALMFSGQVTAIPNYLIMSKIGWLDHYVAIVVPALAKPLGLFLMALGSC